MDYMIDDTLKTLDEYDRIIRNHYKNSPIAIAKANAWVLSDNELWKASIIAVDFDGTLHNKNGEPNKKLFQKLIGRQREGAKIILNTFREGNRLDEAVEFCKAQGLVFDAINENIRITGHRKILADLYIDDHAIRPEWE